MQKERYTVTMFGHIKDLRIFIVTILICTVTACNKNNNKVKEETSLDIEDIACKESRIDEEMVVIAYSIVREKPDENSVKIDTCNRGDKVRVVKLLDNWYEIESCGTTGYISSNNVKSTKEVFVDKEGFVIESVEPDGTIEVEGDISSNIINYAYNYWYIIPENVRKDFKEMGWKIVITNESISEELNISYKVSGATILKDKTIKVYGSQSCIRYALIHEVGHYVDYRNNFISRGDDFKELYNKNSTKLLEYNSNYTEAVYSEEEYFAELYKTYLIGDYNTKIKFNNDINFVFNVSKCLGQ